MTNIKKPAQDKAQRHRGWVTCPMAEYNLSELNDLKKISAKSRYSLRKKSYWYKGLKLTSMFYALILSNLRAICQQKYDPIFYVLNSLTLTFFALDFSQQLYFRKNFLWSLSSIIYFFAILFTFFDYGIFSINDFQYIEYTIYIKILLVNEPIIEGETRFRFFVLALWDYLNRVLKRKGKKDEHFSLKKMLQKRSDEIEGKEGKSPLLDDYVKETIRLAENCNPNDDLLDQKQDIFSDFTLTKNSKLTNLGYSTGTEVQLDKDSKSSEKVIRERISLKVIIWQIVICLTIGLFYKNWVKFTSAFEIISNTTAYQIRDSCLSNESQILITNQIVNNTLVNSKVLFTKILRIQLPEQPDILVSTFNSSQNINPENVNDFFRSYELLTVKSPSDTTSLFRGQCYLVSIVDNRYYFQIGGLMNIIRAIIFIALINFYCYFVAEGQIRDSINAHNQIIELCLQIKMNIKEGGQLAFNYFKYWNSKRSKNDYSHLGKHNHQVKSATWKVIKIAAFLKIGFGDAGIDFIRNFLADEQNRNAVEVNAVIAFMEIREFDYITENLDESIVNFVGEIAELISAKIERSKGFSNKNSEAYFLLIWKCDGNNDDKICQEAFYSIVEALIELHELSKSFSFNKFRKNKKLRDIKEENCAIEKEVVRLTNSREANFQLQVGAGLHFGTVTEGAVGSSYKIDISYISKEVNMASRIQSVTKQFGLRLLMSGKFVEKMTNAYLENLRKIDRVFLKGSNQAIELFTYDGILHGAMSLNYQNNWIKLLKCHSEDTKIPGYENQDFNDEDIKLENLALFKSRDYEDFKQNWDEGFGLYLDGDFKGCVEWLERCNTYLHQFNDKSAKAILNFVKKADKDVLENWQGIRKLENK